MIGRCRLCRYYFKCRVRALRSIIVFISVLIFVVFTLHKTTTTNSGISAPKIEVYCPYEIMEYVDMYSILSIYQPCEGVDIYGDYFIHFHNAILNPFKSKNGIHVQQSHSDVTALSNRRLRSFSCNILCEEFIEIGEEHNYLWTVNDWIDKFLVINKPLSYNQSESLLTVAIVRSDFSNLYIKINELYITFLIGTYFQRYMNCKLRVLLADNLPISEQDNTWQILYKNVKRLTKLDSVVKYKHIVWVMTGANPLSNMKFIDGSYINSFGYFVLGEHGFIHDMVTSCDKLHILILNANSRNLTENSRITRENGIKNNEELVQEIKKLVNVYNVKSILVENVAFKHQLSYVSKTNILIGMHGPKMTHAMFLPKHAAVIELFPLNTPTSNRKYKLLAKSRGLYYKSWQNTQKWNDFNEDGMTYIQPTVILSLVRHMIGKLCLKTIR